MEQPLSFLRLPKVREVTGYSKSTIYRLMAQRRFPPCVKLSDGYSASAWVASEVQDWMASRVAASRPDPRSK
jgi:prophage regulatory protein